MIHKNAYYKSPSSLQPQVTLGYALFDFEVEELIPIGALPLVSHGQCEIENGDRPDIKKESLKSETVEMLDSGRISSVALIDILEPPPPSEAFQSLFARTREALARHVEREAAKVETMHHKVHIRFAR